MNAPPTDPTHARALLVVREGLVLSFSVGDFQADVDLSATEALSLAQRLVLDVWALRPSAGLRDDAQVHGAVSAAAALLVDATKALDMAMAAARKEFPNA